MRTPVCRQQDRCLVLEQRVLSNETNFFSFYPPRNITNPLSHYDSSTTYLKNILARFLVIKSIPCPLRMAIFRLGANLGGERGVRIMRKRMITLVLPRKRQITFSAGTENNLKGSPTAGILNS